MSDIVRIPPTLRELIPISHLALELPSPGVDWAHYLRGRGIEVLFDDVGRPAMSRQVLKQLIQQQKDAEAKARELAAVRDAEFERQRQANLPKGLAWWEVPVGMSPAEAMIAAGGDDGRPHSTVPSPGEWMFGDYEVAGSLESADES